MQALIRRNIYAIFFDAASIGIANLVLDLNSQPLFPQIFNYVAKLPLASIETYRNLGETILAWLGCLYWFDNTLAITTDMLLTITTVRCLSLVQHITISE